MKDRLDPVGHVPVREHPAILIDHRHLGALAVHVDSGVDRHCRPPFRARCHPEHHSPGLSRKGGPASRPVPHRVRSAALWLSLVRSESGRPNVYQRTSASIRKLATPISSPRAGRSRANVGRPRLLPGSQIREEHGSSSASTVPARSCPHRSRARQSVSHLGRPRTKPAVPAITPRWRYAGTRGQPVAAGQFAGGEGEPEMAQVACQQLYPPGGAAHDRDPQRATWRDPAH